MAQKLKPWLPAIIWAGIIFLVSNQQINNFSPFSWPDFILKKSAHVIEYAILFWLVWHAHKSFKLCFIITVLYALSDEWHQTLVAGREGTLRDVGFDSLGMLFSWNFLKNL